MGDPICPFCIKALRFKNSIEGSSRWEYDCLYCGVYHISPEQLDRMACGSPAISGDDRIRIAWAIRARYDSEGSPVVVDDVDSILANAPRPSGPDEKIERILRYAARVSDMSQEMPFHHHEFVRFRMSSENEFGMLKNRLTTEGLLEKVTGLRLTLAGWERVKKLGGAPWNADRGFAAMSFDPDLDFIFSEGIEPGLRDCELP